MADTITFQVEPYNQCRAEIDELLPLHYEEIALNKDRIPLDPDNRAYQEAADLGVMHMVTCRQNGKVVGYVVGFVRPHLHYVSTLHAFTDVYWLHPDHRKGGLGIKLFQKYEESLKERGVVRAYIGCKTFLDLSKLFERLGWTHIEHMFAKML